MHKYYHKIGDKLLGVVLVDLLNLKQKVVKIRWVVMPSVGGSVAVCILSQGSSPLC